MSFRMQLASLSGDAGAYVPLPFSDVGDALYAPPRAPNAVLAGTVGAELEYGHLFAYLFRRFGYPNQPWNGSSELCRYLLTTPRKDLLLSVVPQADASAERSLEFLGPQAVADAARNHVRKNQYEWECRALAHRAARGMPRWLQARVQARSIDKAEKSRAGVTEAVVDDDPGTAWRESLRLEAMDAEATTRRVENFLQRCRQAYAAIEAPPPPQTRTLNPNDWDESDPLKIYALAAIATLRSLMREVKLGDRAIDVFGVRPASRRTLGAAPSAGVACGVLANPDSELYAELVARIVRLGQGDERQGLRRALALLQTDEAR
ncbi:MAG: hypothetical protein QM740_20240 [Acidovorax sp.]